MKASRHIVGGVIGASAVAVLGLGCWGLMMLQGDIASMSLLSLGFAYDDVVLRGMGKRLQGTEPTPFCGSEALEEHLHAPGNGPLQCIAVSIAETSCTPVAHALDIPTYLVPWDDGLSVSLAVTKVEAADITGILEANTREAMLAAGLPRSTPHFNVIGSPKDISSKQCEGYALVTISQHYYVDQYPWCLLNGRC